jgi:tetratricopeptide (TPR) repeat protein
MSPDLAEVRKQLAADPGNPWALRQAGGHYLGDDAYKRAQECYVQALTADPRLYPDIVLDYEEKIGAAPEKLGPRLSLAGFLLAAGATDQAILELEELIDENPQNVEAYNALGRICIKQGKIDETIGLLERSIAAGVKDVRLSETLAWAYLESGRLGDAIKFYEEILAQRPGDKQTLRVLGELYTRTEDYSRAAEKYAAMFSDDPEVVREVIGRLEELLRKVEGNIGIREILADIYMKTLNPDAAVAKLQEIIRLESTKLDEAVQKPKGIIKSYPNHPAATLALAEALRRQKQYSAAAETYQQLFKAKPEQIAEVIAGYEAVLTDCPEQVLARAYLGEALLTQNKVVEALSEYGKMIEADPSVAETVIKKCRDILRQEPQLLLAHIVLGQAYLAKGDFQRAAVEAEGAIALDRNLTGAYLLLGEALEKMNFLRKAAQALHTALVLDPYNLSVHEKFRLVKLKEVEAGLAATASHFDLAKLYLEKGEREPAIRELQQAQKDTVRAASAYNLLGDVYRSEGRYDLAAAQYNHALEMATPELAKTVRFNLGTTYEARGEMKKAVKLYEGIMQEEIDFGDLDRRIKYLKSMTLASMRNRPLLLALSEAGTKEVIGLWGGEAKGGGRAGKKEDVSVSFGHEHNAAGVDYFLKGMYQAAEEELNLAVQLDRRFGAALNNLGVTLAKLGRLDEARQYLAETVQLDPASAIYYGNLGTVNFLLGRSDQALTALEKSHALDPQCAATLLNLGDVYYARREAQRALDCYKLIGAHDTLSDLARKRLRYKVP